MNRTRSLSRKTHDPCPMLQRLHAGLMQPYCMKTEKSPPDHAGGGSLRISILRAVDPVILVVGYVVGRNDVGTVGCV